MLVVIGYMLGKAALYGLAGKHCPVAHALYGDISVLFGNGEYAHIVLDLMGNYTCFRHAFLDPCH